MSRLSSRPLHLAWIPLCSLLALPSCDSGPSEPEQTPTITVTLDPAAATIEQGSSADVQVTVTGGGGFSGAATVTVEGLPAGVTGTVSNVQTSGGTTTGTVTILVGEAVTAGLHNITVRATASGVTTVNVNFPLTVTEAPRYELSATPDQLNVDQNAEGTTDIGIARTNFTGEVTLSVEGAPEGMETAFDVNPVAGDAAVLTIAPTVAVAPDVYDLTIRGTTATLADRTITISVVVAQAPAYELSATPDQLIIEQNAEGTTDIGIARTNFSGEVTLAVEDAPEGMATALDVNPVPGNAAVLTIAPDESVPIDTYTLTLRGTSATLADRTLTISVSVTESTAPDFMIGVTPSTVTVEQGDSDDATVTVTRSNFSGGVALAAEDVPANVTVTFSENPVNDDDSDMTVAVGAEAIPGSYGITVRGTVAGLDDRTFLVTLTVEPPPAYDLSLDPTSITIEQGTSGSVDVEIDRTNFTDEVTLALEGAPGGVTGQFSANPTAGDISVLTLNVGLSVPDGSYTLTVRGTTASLADQTEELTLTVDEPPAYSLSLDPTSVSIDQDASGTVDVAIARTNFTEEVTLALEGAPAGVTAQFDPNPTSGATSVLTLDVGLSVAPDLYPLTVRGTTNALPDEAASLTLTVAEADGFSLDAIAAISIQQGASGTRSVGITRTGGFAGDVTVTVTDLPAGITATVDPVTTAGTTVDVNLDVAGNVPVGNYTATVRGNAAGFPESTQQLDIAVTTSGGQSVSFDFSACPAYETPVWFAYQDGAGPWTPINGLGDVYTFNVTSAEAGIAFATDDNGESNVVVFYATTTEFANADVEELCTVAPSGKFVSATVTGLTANDQARIAMGGSQALTQGPGPVSFQYVPDGLVDIVGYRQTLVGTDNMYIHRDQNPTDGQDIGTIDFNGPLAFPTTSATVTLQGGSGGESFWWTEYATSPAAGVCYYAPLRSRVPTFGVTQFIARGVPSGQQSADEYHVVTASEESASGIRTVSETFATLASRTIIFGAALPTPTVTDISGSAGYRRVRYETTLPAEYDDLVSFGLSDTGGDRNLVVFATVDRLGGASISVEVPDFTGLGGWNDAWAPRTTFTSDWFFTADGYTGDDCTEGARDVSIIGYGTIG